MSWNAVQRRWFKNYQGKMYAVSPRQLGCEPNKGDSRPAANEWWEKKLLEIGDKPKPPRLPDVSQYMRRLLQESILIDVPTFEEGDDPGADRFNEAIERLLQNIDQQPFELDVSTPANQPLKLKVGKKIVSLPSEDDFGNIKTIDAAIKVFLDRKQAQVHGGQRAVGRWSSIKCHLQYFSTWVGAGNSIELIDGSMLEAYHSHLLKKLTNN